MAKKRNWKKFVFSILKIGANAVTLGWIGSGRRTQKAGEVGGKLIDKVDEAIENSMEEVSEDDGTDNPVAG